MLDIECRQPVVRRNFGIRPSTVAAQPARLLQRLACLSRSGVGIEQGHMGDEQFAAIQQGFESLDAGAMTAFDAIKLGFDDLFDGFGNSLDLGGLFQRLFDDLLFELFLKLVEEFLFDSLIKGRQVDLIAGSVRYVSLLEDQRQRLSAANVSDSHLNLSGLNQCLSKLIRRHSVTRSLRD